MGKLEKRVISTLEGRDEGLTLAEIAQATGESEKKVFKALRKLFEKDLVDTGNRRYKLSNR
ncbi:MAG: winged helix DNA-binding protein [Candidatus Bathyarchaeota archaeon]|nr:winged helix DNA-binding protein [Candidatus Bathyarchaeota archaeon]